MPSKPVPDEDGQSALEEFVEALPPERAAVTRHLHRLIQAAHPGFSVAIKYGQLMYAVNGDWRHWVVAIDAHPKAGVGLRFLFGVMMNDERHVLRAGSSVLMTWNFPPGGPVDEGGVSAYVAKAVRLYPDYKANDRAILESARASAASRNRRGTEA
jgi:hypothetical protein